MNKRKSTKNLDVLELKLAKCGFSKFSHCEVVVSVLINGVDLIEIVRKVELPFATKEGVPQIAGSYSGQCPYELFYELEEKDNEKSRLCDTPPEVLCCTCGCPGCWPLYVVIKKTENTVTWSKFRNPFRTECENPDHVWDYTELRSFCFDRKQYENEMKKLKQWAIETDPRNRKEMPDENLVDGEGFTRQDVIDAHAFSINNEEELMKENKCGCFYCCEIFDPKEIEEWADDAEGTALCPFCGIDSVIGESSGYPITKEFLEAMKKYWF